MGGQPRQDLYQGCTRSASSYRPGREGGKPRRAGRVDWLAVSEPVMTVQGGGGTCPPSPLNGHDRLRYCQPVDPPCPSRLSPFSAWPVRTSASSASLI